MKMGQSNIAWILTRPKDLSEFTPRLMSAVKEKVTREAGGEMRRLRCLLVAPEWISMPEILGEIYPVLAPLSDGQDAMCRIGMFGQCCLL